MRASAAARGIQRGEKDEEDENERVRAAYVPHERDCVPGDEMGVLDTVGRGGRVEQTVVGVCQAAVANQRVASAFGHVSSSHNGLAQGTQVAARPPQKQHR